MPDKCRRIKIAPATRASCLLLTAFGLLLAGCAGDRRVAAGDPLLGGAAPGVVNPQAAAPPSNPTPVASAPNLAAPNLPPLPPISPTSSNAALASGGSPPLDGGRDLRIGDPRAAPGAPGWQAPQTATPVSTPPGPPPVQPASSVAPAYARSFGPMPSARIVSYEQAQAFLASRGVNWQRLETFGDQGEWRFSCSLPNPQNRNINRTYEGKARDYLSAIRIVIDQMSRDQ
jgi:hypothetical protein